MPRKYVDAGDCVVHCLHTGPTTLPDAPPRLERGRTVLLLHGAGGNAGEWQQQLAGIEAAGHSAVALDLPGHGRSPGVEGPASVDAAVAVVVAACAALALRPAVVVGRDLGGIVALGLAARHPARVAALVLTGTAARIAFPADLVQRTRDVVRGRLPQQFGSEAFAPATPMDVRRAAWMQQVQTDPRVWLQDLLAADDADAGPLLAAVRAPVHVVAGADDALVPPAAQRALAAAIPGARVTTLADAGHQAPLEQADAFTAAIVAAATEAGA